MNTVGLTSACAWLPSDGGNQASAPTTLPAVSVTSTVCSLASSRHQMEVRDQEILAETPHHAVIENLAQDEDPRALRTRLEAPGERHHRPGRHDRQSPLRVRARRRGHHRWNRRGSVRGSGREGSGRRSPRAATSQRLAFVDSEADATHFVEEDGGVEEDRIDGGGGERLRHESPD